MYIIHTIPDSIPWRLPLLFNLRDLVTNLLEVKTLILDLTVLHFNYCY